MKHILLFIFTFMILASSAATGSVKPGLYVDGRYLYTPAGEKLILKGFNAMIVYWDLHGVVNFPEIEKTGANCVRIFWKLDGWTPPASDLDKVLTNCIKNKMIPIICLWDATGDWSKIQFCVDYWTSPSIAAVLKKHEKSLIVNIANEPGNKAMGNAVFTETYSGAVQQMRDAGIRAPLMIDADQWGRNANSVLNTGQQLLELDPEHNLIFSWHLWDPANWGTGKISEIDRIVNTAVDQNICFIVGEFGPCERCDNCTSTKINWEYLIEKCHNNEIGYLPWVWRWTDCHSCITYNPGKYGEWTNSPWGEGVSVSHEFSIKNTSVRPQGMITSATLLSNPSIEVNVYPNPFSSTVTFNIYSVDDSEYSLHIYSLTGVKVAVAHTGQLQQGLNQTIWNPGKELQDGMYLYKLIEGKEGSKISFHGKFIKN
jgi:mannan endo-1,4-beta-mannosidase